MHGRSKVISEALIQANGLDFSAFLREYERLEGILIEDGVKNDLIIFFVYAMPMGFPIGMEAIYFNIPKVSEITNLDTGILKIRSTQFIIFHTGVNNFDLLSILSK
jgi:hypothetical protein